MADKSFYVLNIGLRFERRNGNGLDLEDWFLCPEYRTAL